MTASCTIDLGSEKCASSSLNDPKSFNKFSGYLVVGSANPRRETFQLLAIFWTCYASLTSDGTSIFGWTWRERDAS